ncbi:putative dehydrogenase [Sinobacterium caligoides]|uniref:Putative dehydrogenase n=1 Tax=Sinobacterium caligoides TaxID=933926 RepID=A0A3N2DMN0_9GAMM|nr:Gfo/Idh/MocA family oxidoreductase [Sinobacterium caligoides]ROS01076.1 putative dehydrogenase [Sinobacterium caligoides]
MKKSIRWGIIGCGAVTEVKSGPAYQKTNGFQLAAVMRRSKSLAKDYAQRHNVEAYYCCADALINDESIDAIYIATPPDTHKQYALRVAEAGKVCCIEKPIAPTYEDSKEILEAFERAKVPLFVAYYRRSLPRFNKVKELLESGSIGIVRHISWHLNKPANDIDLSRKYNWRTDKDIALGGYFDDLASHGLDLFAYLLGEFEVVRGVGSNQQGLYSSLDAVSACWAHKSGATGAGSWNFGGFSRKDAVTIYGSDGELSFSVFDEQPITLSQPTRQQEIHIENPQNIQLYHVNNIAKQLFSGCEHPSSGATATHTSWVMDQILRADG